MLMIRTTWTELKTRATNHSLKIQYTESEGAKGTEYYIWIVESLSTFLTQINDIENTSDVIDFETNYKAAANDKMRLSVDTTLAIENNLATQIYGWDTGENLFKKVLIKPYPNPTSTQGWLSIFGEVGSTTRAKAPIDFTVRKSVATIKLAPLVDKTVPTGKIWYITSLLFSNDNSSELQFFRGIQRTRVVNFSGTGSQLTFQLSYQAISHATYITVKVGGTTKTLDTDYTVEDSTDDKKSNIVFKVAPPSGTNNIEVTYDAVERRRDFFVQASDSFEDTLPTPIRLTENGFFIGAVINKGGNAAISIVTVGGFELNPSEEIW